MLKLVFLGLHLINARRCLQLELSVKLPDLLILGLKRNKTQADEWYRDKHLLLGHRVAFWRVVPADQAEVEDSESYQPSLRRTREI